MTGFTGDSDKASWIKMELGFDWAFNYKTQDVGQTLKIAAPGYFLNHEFHNPIPFIKNCSFFTYTLGGVDIFLDCVGGSIHSTILTHHMNLAGRVCIFGNLALYNNDAKVDPLPPIDLLIALKVNDQWSCRNAFC